MLDPEATARILDPAMPLGVVIVGVSVFLEDEVVQKTLSDLFDWVAPGSFLVADFDGEALASYPAVLAILDQAGEPLHLRGSDRIRPLLGRWRLTEDEIRPVNVWRNESAPEPGQVFMYGCVARKP
jgi:hypothetical protein